MHCTPLFSNAWAIIPSLICLHACSSPSPTADGSPSSTAGSSNVAGGASAGETSQAGTASSLAGAGATAGADTANGGLDAGGTAGAAVMNGGSAGVSSAGVSGSIAGGSSGAAGAGAGAGGSGSVAGGANVAADFFARYEAEATLNTLTYPVERIATEGAVACPANGVKEGANCASGGKVVAQILGRSPCQPATSTTSYTDCQNMGGGVTFNQVTVPADGTYDVTFWYHCGPDTPGHADVYGDTKCGGLNYGTGAGTGCRPHLIDVNGAPISATSNGKPALYFQFPCYTAPWSVIHGATTALPLKTGANTIYIHAPGATTLDAVDLDALDVQASGHGAAPAPLWPKLVTPVLTGN